MTQIDLFPKDLGTPNDVSSLAQSLKIMRVMAQLEPVPTALLDVLLQLLPVQTAHLKYFRGPIVVGASSWSEMLPDWLLQAIKQERFLLILDEFEQGTVTENVTPAEIVCALQPLTLEAPLRHDYAELCLWAFDQVMQRHDRLPEGCHSFFELAGGHPTEPSQYVLQELSSKIRRSVVRRAPKVRKAIATPGTGIEPGLAESNQIEKLQIDLFDS